MQPIHPITVKTCRDLIGKTVLLYLNNGLEFRGIVSRIENNKLILNDSQQVKLNSASKSSKTNPSSKKGKKKSHQPDLTLQVTPTNQLSSFGLPLFGGMASAPQIAPAPVEVHMDRIAAMFAV